MRELKFRGWANSCFVYFDLKEDNDFAFHDFCSCCEPDSIEQYTGLKDTNGKEIYEGDIVMLLNYHIELNGIMECLKTDIQWDNENACFILGVTKFGSKLLLQNTEGYVVIGNIHENPKLLGYNNEK